MNQSYLLLGSNIGDRAGWLQLAREALHTQLGTIKQASAIYETEAWGKEDQAAFLNQAIWLETSLSAPELLAGLQQIEKDIAHRERLEKWAPRTLDIDILFFNQEVIHQPGLTVPHPHLQERRFALTPLCDIAADYRHPVLGKTVAALLAACPDLLAARPLPILAANT